VNCSELARDRKPSRNEPGIDQAGVVDESRHELHLSPAAYLRRSDMLKAGMNTHTLQSCVVSLDDAFRIGLADGGSIRVRGVQQELDRGGMSAVQIAGIVVGNNDSGVYLGLTD